MFELSLLAYFNVEKLIEFQKIDNCTLCGRFVFYNGVGFSKNSFERFKLIKKKLFAFNCILIRL